MHIATCLRVPLLLAFLICFGGCAGKQTETSPSHEPGQFITADGSLLSPADLASLAGEADYLLIGERHGNAVDHAAQAAFLAAIAHRGIRPVVGLEMLPRSRFAAELERFAQGSLPLDSLPAALDWENSWGFDFALYSPVFVVAREHHLPVYGLNIPHDIRAAFSRKGSKGLTAKEKAQLPKRIIPPLAEQKAALSEFYRSHSAMLAHSKNENVPATAAITKPALHPAMGDVAADANMAEQVRGIRPATQGAASGLERFLLVQSLWDSTMAEEAFLLRARTGRPVAVLAGAAHVERGWGIAHRLSLLDPNARVLLILPFSGKEPDPESADIFFYSPRRSRTGYGITLAQRQGVLVTKAVSPESPAAQAGLMPGDILLAAGSVSLNSPADLHRAAVDARARKAPLHLRVERDGSITEIILR
jgi:uncharacterized iron-regulated protein